MEDDRDSWRDYCGAGYEYNVYPENYNSPEEYEADLAMAMGERHANVSSGPKQYYSPNKRTVNNRVNSNKKSSDRGAAPEDDKKNEYLAHHYVNQSVMKEGDFEYEKTDGGIRLDEYKPKESTKEIVIPDRIADKKVIEIGNFAFAGWDEIERVEIPEGVEALGEGVFWGCHNLSAVVLPDSLKKIEIDLKTMHGNRVRYKAEIEKHYVFPPASLTGTFDNTGIEEIVIPSQVDSIGEFCFCGCPKLRKVVLPEALTELEHGTFMFCEALVSLRLPEHLKKIGSAAFDHCSNLRSIYIPDSVEEIKDNAFQHDNYFDRNELVTIVCNPGSYAERYAKKQRLHYAQRGQEINILTEEAGTNANAAAVPEIKKQIEVMDDTFAGFGLKVLQVSNADLSGTIFGKECLSFFVELQALPEIKFTGKIALKANVYDSEDTLIAMGSEPLDLDNFAGYDTLEIQVIHSSLQNRAAKARIFAVKA